MRGTDRIFKRGAAYWIAYYYGGKEYSESSDSENDALGVHYLLKTRIGEVVLGRFIGPDERA